MTAPSIAMVLDAASAHLTCSTDVQATERWSEVRALLDRFVVPLRNRVARGRRFGLGLRLSGRTVMDLEAPRAFAELRDWLERHDAYLFTLNGGVYGRFQGPPVKTAAYRPDWLDEERLRYTDRLAGLLAALLPPHCTGTIDTIPGAFRGRVRSRLDDAAIADRILRHVAMLVRLHDRTGKAVALALEPEPACRLETVGETVEFFDRHLHARAAVARVVALTGLGTTAAADAIRRHVGVCLDACNVATEFEEPAIALRALTFAGVPVVKVQLATALRLRPPLDQPVQAALQAFASNVRLQPVVVRTPRHLRRFIDLPLALAAPPLDGEEWRVSVHAPIAAAPSGPIGTTQRELTTLLGVVGRMRTVPHLEVETHLPIAGAPAPRTSDMVAAMASELEWATGFFAEVAKTA
jgi:hypothetical protein